ncbi:MAG: ATP-dependent DNA helicase RecG [Bacilli bacterium]|nr:ATP-dependent DNA helicase RecG [Bacilli bacterium]
MELSEVKGIGINTIKDLNNLGINNVYDLVTYYPFRYDVFEKTDISKLADGDKIVIDGVVENVPNVFYISRVLNKMTFRLNIGTKILTITIFNRAYFKRNINVGTTLTVIGKYDAKHNSVTASNLKLGLLEKTIIEPVYHTSNKINSKKINKIVNSALPKIKVKDYIPENISNKYHFIDKNRAVYLIHNPENKHSVKQAINRLKYEELFVFMSKISYLKKNHTSNDGLERKVNFKKIEKFINNLPFKLTKDQLASINDIYDDLTSKRRMNRLLQGDVGSGKTIVSFISLYINYLGGYQGALMAPTEILAFQHYQNIKKLFPDLNIVLLTGKTKVKERKEILKQIKKQTADIIIGTHALISDTVEYKNLGLVITDEQHRFGVNQRANLKNKGITPDILYMSATPIPRTYALTLYGDMDISSIKTMPSGRKPVTTILKKDTEIKDVLYMMLDEIKKHHQIYVIAPLVEESEKIDMENVYQLEEKMKKAFGKICNIGILHGKMKADEKEKAMNKFKNNETQILISTTVIEVGVDVANATMMVIFDSYRFGLSALHQLRGRVGRNDLDSYCVLISDRETKRLSVLTKTTDGFKVSEEDFLLRGSGDLFGQRQSGDMSFKLADIKNDYQLLLQAKEDGEKFVTSSDYTNEKNKHIRQMIEQSTNLD